MAVAHFAWSLDTPRFHAAIAMQVKAAPGGLFGALSGFAAPEWLGERPTTTEYLAALRLVPGDHDAWAQVLDPRDTDSRSRAIAELYSVAMTRFLEPAPRLREPWILEYSLSEMGWSPKAVDRAVCGRSLASLAETLAPPAATELASALTYDRGWLGVEDRRTLVAGLDEVEAWFLDPPVDFVERLSERLFRPVPDVRTAIRRAREDAVAMYDFANDAQHVLRLILD